MLRSIEFLTSESKTEKTDHNTKIICDNFKADDVFSVLRSSITQALCSLPHLDHLGGGMASHEGFLSISKTVELIFTKLNDY